MGSYCGVIVVLMVLRNTRLVGMVAKVSHEDGVSFQAITSRCNSDEKTERVESEKMIVWKFAIYLGVLTLLFALFMSVVAIARYGRGRPGVNRNAGSPTRDGLPGHPSS